MTKCTNPEQGQRLYAWETGLLGEADQGLFEQHLVECRFCAARAERFVDAAELLRNDQSVRSEVDSIAREDASSRRRRWSVPAVIAAAAVLVLLILQPWQIEFKPTQEAFAGGNRLAVFSFDNVENPDDPNQLGELIAALLIEDLANSRYLQLVPGSRLREFVSQPSSAKQDNISVDRAIEAARQGHANWLLTGSLVRSLPTMTVSTQLVDVITGNVTATIRIEARPDENIYDLVDRLSVQVKSDLALPEGALAENDPPVVRVTSASREAYLYYIRGVEYREKAYYDEARAAFEMALEADSTFAMAWMYMASLKDQRLIEKAVRYSDNTSRRQQQLILMARAYHTQELDQLESLATEMLAEYPDDLPARRFLGYCALVRGKYREAIARYRQAISIDPLDRISHLWLCRILIGQGTQEELLEAAEQFVAVAPEEAQPLYVRGVARASGGDLSGAINDLSRVRGIKPDFNGYRPLLQLGRYYVFAREYGQARECFQQVIIRADRPTRSEARTMLAAIPVYRGKFNEGLELLADGITADRMELASSGFSGSRALKHYMRSMVFAEQGNLDSAYSEMETAIRVHEEEPTIQQPAFRCAYAQMLASGGAFEKAEEIRDTLKAEFEAGHGYAEYAHAYAQGCIQFERGHVDSAFATLSVLKPAHGFDGSFQYGRAALASGHYKEAIESFQHLLSDYSLTWRLVYSIWSVKSYYYLGQAYDAMDRRDESIEAYQNFLEIMSEADPGNAAVDDARERLARLTS